MESITMNAVIKTSVLLYSVAADHVGRFFFSPASPRPLALFRMGLSMVLLWQAFLMRNNYLNFLAYTGFVQGDVSAMIQDPAIPRLNALIQIFSRFSITESSIITGFCVFYVVALLFLFCGLFTRISAVFAWLLHWTIINTGFSGAYGVDMYAHIFLFYCMLFPVGHAYSLDCKWRKVSGKPSFMARLGLRTLQLHMCISYLASGLEKASSGQWWNGQVIWRALTTPGYNLMDFYWLAQFPILFVISGWLVIAIETLYCIMMWNKNTRSLWVFSTCALHCGIALFLRLPVFGIFMCVPTITLFAITPSEGVKAIDEQRKY